MSQQLLEGIIDNLQCILNQEVSPGMSVADFVPEKSR